MKKIGTWLNIISASSKFSFDPKSFVWSEYPKLTSAAPIPAEIGCLSKGEDAGQSSRTRT
jgi:hypothetical protein